MAQFERERSNNRTLVCLLSVIARRENRQTASVLVESRPRDARRFPHERSQPLDLMLSGDRGRRDAAIAKEVFKISSAVRREKHSIQ
jgi:hypothetical protein